MEYSTFEFSTKKEPRKVSMSNRIPRPDTPADFSDDEYYDAVLENDDDFFDISPSDDPMDQTEEKEFSDALSGDEDDLSAVTPPPNFKECKEEKEADQESSVQNKCISQGQNGQLTYDVITLPSAFNNLVSSSKVEARPHQAAHPRGADAGRRLLHHLQKRPY